MAVAFAQGQRDIVCDLAAQLSAHIGSDCPSEIPGLIDNNIISILFSLLDTGGTRTTALNCLVNISSLSPGYHFVFESPVFLGVVFRLFEVREATATEKHHILRLFHNVLYSASPEAKSFIRRHFSIDRLAAMTATANAEVLFAVLDCLKQLAKFCADVTAFRAILTVIKSTNVQVDCERHVQGMIWALIYAIHNDAFEVESFVALGFPSLLQAVLDSPNDNCVVLGCRFIRLMLANYDVKIGFRVQRILDVLKSSEVDDHAAVCASALGLLFEHQPSDALHHLEHGIFPLFLTLFQTRGIRSKIALVRVFSSLVRASDSATFPSILNPLPGSHETVFTICSELFETHEIEVSDGLLRLFLAIFEKADSFSSTPQARLLFPYPSLTILTSDDEFLASTPLLTQLQQFTSG
jgi:hypothetical protein